MEFRESIDQADNRRHDRSIAERGKVIELAENLDSFGWESHLFCRLSKCGFHQALVSGFDAPTGKGDFSAMTG